MGGDHAPAAIVDGAVAAARHLDVPLALVGQARAMRAALAKHADWRSLGLDIVDTPDAIEMGESPALALRRKPRASVRIAADLVASGDARAFFSAGNTGATVI